MKESKDDKSIDIVIPYSAKFSAWESNELRYFLRSAEEHFEELGNVFVAGDCPPWAKNVVHIPSDDPYPAINKDANIISKLLLACSNSELSKHFISANDDALFLKPVKAKQLAPRCSPRTIPQLLGFSSDTLEVIAQEVNGLKLSTWQEALLRTYVTLKKSGLSAWNYESHIPMIYDKEAFTKAMSLWPWEKEAFTYHTLYFNSYRRLEPRFMRANMRFTVKQPMSLKDLEEGFSKAVFLDYDDNGLNYELKQAIQQRFPKPSKFERHD